MDASDRTRRNLGRLAAALLGTTLALAIALVVVIRARPVRKQRTEGEILQQALNDPAVRAQLMARYVERNPGIWDSHNDPQVGRVLQQGLRERAGLGTTITSNRFGLRERDFDCPKPAGTTRVVLLGDSLIFGEGCAAQDRVGVVLERYLTERATSEHGPIEVLHVGVGSWNIVAECAFLRRELSLFQPDLVIHLTTGNDLDDMDGVRGFGSKAPFSPQRRDAADSLVRQNYPTFILGVGGSNSLALGLDYESRSRFERAGRSMRALSAAVEASGARYLAWFHWGGLHDFVKAHLDAGLRPEQILYNSRAFAGNHAYWVKEDDSHWNPTGMVRMAKLLYAVIQERGLLPALGLPAWEEASEIRAEEHDKELDLLDHAPRYDDFLARQRIGRDFVFAELSDDNAACVNGGLDVRGRVSPQASFTMQIGKLAEGTRLGIRGHGLGRPEIDGVEVAVSVDEIPLGTFRVPAAGAFEQAWELPRELDGRRLVTVRLVASDYAYDEQNLQHCVVFELERIVVF